MKEKGYCIFDNVLTAEEILYLRIATREHFRTTGRLDPLGGLRQANVAVEIPTVAWLFHDPRILACVRAALGTERIVFTSDATAYKDVLIGWHKDDAGYFDEPTYGIDACAVYKVGLYLFDHDQDGCGLWVREGSHRSPQHTGPIRDTALSAGSIVIFDVRITHRGLAKSPLQRALLRMSSYLPGPLQRCVEAGLCQVRTGYRALIGRQRIALIFTYGLANDYTFEFAKRSMRRQLDDTPGTSPLLPPKLRAAFAAQQVLLAEDYFRDLRHAQAADTPRNT